MHETQTHYRLTLFTVECFVVFSNCVYGRRGKDEKKLVRNREQNFCKVTLKGYNRETENLGLLFKPAETFTLNVKDMLRLWGTIMPWHISRCPLNNTLGTRT